MPRSRSLAKIHQQIEKLQKEAASIQATVIARLKREIAQHGLTAEQLFGTADSTYVGNGRRSKADSARGSKPKKADKPPKFADEQGNTWHGIGKRPPWIHAALAAGRTLEDLLVGKAAKAPSTSTVKKAGNERPQARRERKKVAPAKKAATAAGAAKPARSSRGAKTAAATTRSPASKKAVRKQPAKKAAPAKRSAKAGKAAAPIEGGAEQSATT